MSRKITWTPPTNFISEQQYLRNGIKRYKVTLECTSCKKHYVVSDRQSALNKKTTLCKECFNKSPRTEEEKKNISIGTKKRYQNPINRQLTSQAMKGIMSGNKHWNWKGGITPKNQEERNTLEYKQWRTNVFQRDDYTCQMCMNRGHELNAHHIKEWASSPEHRFNVDNGITLCKPCHYLIHKFEYTKNQLLKE
jgi:5-methylcytosine-specific restriction endonuclease McrA